MNEAGKILNAKENSLGHTVDLRDVTTSQISQIKTTRRSEKHWLYVSIFVFADDSYILLETNRT